jgi:hypothetical protein
MDAEKKKENSEHKNDDKTHVDDHETGQLLSPPWRDKWNSLEAELAEAKLHTGGEVVSDQGENSIVSIVES